MTDIVEFIKARLAEDEQVAIAADVKQGDPVWFVSPVLASLGRNYTVRSRRDSRPIARLERLDGDDGQPAEILDAAAVAEHIARHDPARVLREVEALRAVVEECESTMKWVEELRERGEPSEAYARHVGSLLGVLRTFAAVWSDHPDYQESWRP